MTDVISFALEEDEPDIIGLDIPRVLGDIICTDVAKEQAESYNHSFERTWFLALHGFTLIRYDHMNEEDEKCLDAKRNFKRIWID